MLLSSFVLALSHWYITDCVREAGEVVPKFLGGQGTVWEETASGSFMSELSNLVGAVAHGIGRDLGPV